MECSTTGSFSAEEKWTEQGKKGKEVIWCMRKWKKAVLGSLMTAFLLPQVIIGGSQPVEAASGKWEQNSRGWFYVYSDGTYATDTWIEEGGKWYYMNSYGYRISSWKELDGKWYYFEPDGTMTTKWKQIGVKWYYFGTNGVLCKGWTKIGKKWFYFESDGVLQTGWKQISGKTYYFGYDGAMATGTTVIAGKSYRFDSNGVLESGSSDVSGAKVGDLVTFGSYEQDNVATNGQEAIEWIVLDKKSDGSLLLISRFGLDAMPYHEKLGPFSWDMSSIRRFLNGTFYNTAFSASEKEKVLTTTVVNEDNFFWGTKGGSNTNDKVFLLSSDEAKKYFVDDSGKYDGGDSSARACTLTAYAISRGGEASYGTKWWSDNCWYWLRSPGQYSNYAAYVYRNGYVSFDYDGIDPDTGVVRPAIWVKP